MKTRLLLLLVGWAAASDLSDVLQLRTILEKPRQLDRNKPRSLINMEQKLSQMMSQKTRPILGFAWSDCGNADSMIHVRSLSIHPDPVSLPGQISVSAVVNLLGDIGNTSKISASVELEKKVAFIWVHIPCMHHTIGSCSYDDVCALDPYKNSECPPIFTQRKLPCKCPFAKNLYNIPQTSFHVKHSVPSGDYQGKVSLQTAGREIGCIKFAVSIQ